MLSTAFNAILRIHSKAAQLKRLGSPDITSDCRISPSNYFRFLRGPETTTISAKEFIIPVASISGDVTAVEKGDRIIEGTNHYTIDEIIEMHDLGGTLMGYRVRCE